MAKNNSNQQGFREKLFHIIFGTHTREGKTFDIVLLFFIAISVLLVMLDSIPSFAKKHHEALIIGEWILTIVFTIEYILRIYVIKNKWQYIFSFYGIIDLISILPTYIGIFFPQSRALTVVRALRLFRIFRIFKLTQFIRGRNIITSSLKESWPKITVFLYFVTLMVIVLGSVMYLVEGDNPESGFTSIPQSVYWAVVTLTTVGYGDISPITPLGKFIASLVMIIGYGIIAVPTGILSVEVAKYTQEDKFDNLLCDNCELKKHEKDAIYCKRCSHKLIQ